MKIQYGHGPARVRDTESGQALVMAAFCMVALLAAAGIVVDIGYLYYAYQTVQATTQAAALAGGENLQFGTAQATAYEYSGGTMVNAKYNIPSNLTITSVTATPECLGSSSYDLQPCGVVGAQASANAITVTETATMNTFFARLFGVPTWNVSATATASGNGGGLPPYNILMILDTTASMGQGTDTNCISGSTSTKGYSPEACAQYGLQTLLSDLNPCSATYSAQHSGCGTATNGNVANPWDEVALAVFPGLCPTSGSSCAYQGTGTATVDPTTSNLTQAQSDTNCPSSNPATTGYNNNPIYLVQPMSTDYRASDAATTLNASSGLVTAAGGNPSCNGVGTPGGWGTFYAGAITWGAQYMTSSQVQRTGVQNVMILLSDGDAQATGSPSTSNNPKDDMFGETTTNGATYTGTADCTQAVSAATYAKNLGIKIYSVSYGSETSGCSTGEKVTPCQTMEAIASSPTSTYFFSVPDSATTSGTICSGARPDTQLNQVFQDIEKSLTNTRLIPNGTT